MASMLRTCGTHPSAPGMDTEVGMVWVRELQQRWCLRSASAPGRVRQGCGLGLWGSTHGPKEGEHELGLWGWPDRMARGSGGEQVGPRR